MEGNGENLRKMENIKQSETSSVNISSNVVNADKPAVVSNTSLQSFSSSFINKPIASSSPITYPDFDIQKLKALMPQDMDRTPMPRSEPSSIGQSTIKQTESYSSGSERDEGFTGILKKSTDVAADQASTSGSVKDIKVFQSGGVLILQNIKDSSDDAGKKALSEISSKLIEDCHKLSEELKEEPKETRVVQFDLTSTAESPSDSLRIGREQPSSLSTNESLPWQSVGMSSPSSSTCARRLEWDSGADVGYSDKDMSKEKMSTLERQALQGFNPLGKVINTRRGDNVLRRIPSDLIEVDERHSAVSVKDAATDPHTVPEHAVLSRRSTSDSNQYTAEETETTLKPDSENSLDQKKLENSKTSRVKNVKKGKENTDKIIKSPRQKSRSKDRKSKNSSSESGADVSAVHVKNKPKEKAKCATNEKVNTVVEIQPIMKDHSASVNTLGEEFGFYRLQSSESSEQLNKEKSSPRTKKLKKKKPPEMSVRSRKINEIIEIARSFSQTDETERKLDEITVDHSFQEEQNKNIRPISASSSNKTVVAKQVEEKTVQTSFREGESKGVQAEPKFKRTTSKNIQASGELNSLPKHLDIHQFFEMSGAVRSKSTQFFGDGVNSLPRGLNHGDRVRKSKEPQIKLEKKNEKEKKTKDVSGLTVEVLRQRREVADPSIIQEKFFESQRKVSKSTSMENTIISRNLISASTSMDRHELKKKDMVCASTSIDRSRIAQNADMVCASTSIDKSRITQNADMVCASTSIDKSRIDHADMVCASTSMERNSNSTVEPKKMVAASTSTDQIGYEELDETKETRKMVSVGVQYSPKNDSKKLNQQNESRDTRMSDNQQQVVRDAWTDTLDSQASSTQTAHSWVHGGGAPARESVVRTTRSFEYLPGEVYESSGNLREKLPSDASHNVITESSSSADSDIQPHTKSPVQSDFESIQGVGVASLNLSGNTVVIDDSCPTTPAAWVMITGGPNGVQIIKKAIDTLEDKQESSSDGSRKSNSNESTTVPNRVISHPGVKGTKNNNDRKINGNGNDFSEVSKCSAGVQTETLLESSSQRRDSDLLRLFRRIEQFLIAQSDRNHDQIHSLDRGSSKMASAGYKTSISLQSSPKRNVNYSQKSAMITNGDEFDTVVCSSSKIGTRASSTPKLPSISDNQCMKMSSENLSPLNSDRNSAFSSRDRPSPSVSEQHSKDSKSEKSFQDDHQNASKSVCKDSETQVGLTLTKCICTHCTCRHSAPAHVDQATQMSLKNYKTQLSPKDSTICQQCKKKPCACQLLTSPRSFSDDRCSHCKIMPCICRQVKTDRSSKSLNDSSNRKVKCSECEMVTCICRKPEQLTSSSDKQLKFINGQVFSTYLDDDFSSSEALPSSTSTSDKRPSINGMKKKTDACSVCRCATAGKQSCVFCVCHIDKHAHIPRCDCHEKIPRFLIPGFCKCHRRNLRYFDKCKCCVQTEMVDNICPCCEYFAVRMRAKFLESQLEQKDLSSKSEEPPQPKNYFLKLEETEISKDSSEISEQEKQPLEVVTIKIPVKRMGKTKVPCQQFYYGGQLMNEVSDSRRTESETIRTSNRLDKDIEYLDDIVKKYLLSSQRTDSRSKTNKEDNLSSKRRDKLTRSDRESGKSSTSYRTLQECLESNRPDFFSSAEFRREVIRKKASEREHRNQKHMICNRQMLSSEVEAPKRIFTTSEIRAQTRKKCKQLSEVTQKKEDRKKRELYQTNKIMAEIYAKRLQLKTLRGQLNISNSCNLLAT